MALRWYQSEACAAVWDYLCGSAGNPLVCLPTGSGKSHVISELARTATEVHNGRVLVLAHRKELLTQNAGKMAASAGVYSAGLKRRETEQPVVVAGIQSAHRRACEFGSRNLVLIDEAHLVPHDGEGMYRRFLDDLRAANPHLRVVGTTATPYRLDCGPLCRPDGIFQRVCYSAPVRALIQEGHLCRLTTTPSETVIDTSGVKLRGGEFIQSESEKVFCNVVEHACKEIVCKCESRRSVLVFCSGVRHAEQVVACLEYLTHEPVGLVTGDTYPLVRANVLDDFRAGRLRWCVNVDVLTTGFDSPTIDGIAVLRATMSPGLFSQMVGRGFRTSPGKSDCLVLDFGGNIRRHGPIDSPDYGVQDKRQRHAGEMPVKVCPNCEQETLLSAAECSECGFAFPRDTIRHETKADEAQILSDPVTLPVVAVGYHVHRKRNKPDAVPSMRVDYECERKAGDLLTISEWVCIEHSGFAGKKAAGWWRQRTDVATPATVLEAVELARRGALAPPRIITAQQDGRWWRVIKAELDERCEMVEAGVVDDLFIDDLFADEDAPF